MNTTFYVRREGDKWVNCDDEAVEGHREEAQYKVFASDIPILGGCLLEELGTGKPADSLEATICRWLTPIVAKYFGLGPNQVFLRIDNYQ